MSDLYLVEGENYRILKKEEISIKGIGHKGYGLTHVPKRWTLPFFVISKELYRLFKNLKSDERKKIVALYAIGIKKCATKMSINPKWIIRSSACNESMKERGQYDSVAVNEDQLENTLYELLMSIIQDTRLCKSSISFIVQHYIDKKICGHISNERRLSQDPRDYKIEYEYNNEIKHETVVVRQWRKKYDKNQLKKIDLDCDTLQNIKKTLHFPAFYFYNSTKRVHLEFIWEKEKIYIVQCDYEVNENNTHNPENQKIGMSMAKKASVFKVLREIDDKEDKKYYKIKNVFIYKSVGLTTAPLYILDDNLVLKKLQHKDVSSNLIEDINLLLQNSSIVIRTNVITDEHDKRQLSKRSNELKDLNSVIEWLKSAVDDLKGLEYVFILHNFIPSISSAFVWAKPNSRFVRIQSLWGLPEGLYYYPHDSFSVDLRNTDTHNINQDKIEIKKIIRYKPHFISTNADGTWSLKNTSIPHDWKVSIDDNSLKEIAIASQKISNIENKEISVMWFINVDQKYYGTKNLPWYHEEIKNLNIKENDFIKKYFDDEEIVISNNLDFSKILEPDNEIKYVRIQPYEDDVLRDKNFLMKIGEICKQKNITIFLEGTVLAHSYYQLMKTGANIVVSDIFKDFNEKIEFNKLVRDKIPQNILDNGEFVEYGYVEESLLFEFLLKKVIEESYEIYDSHSKDELIIEIADLLEVLSRLRKEITNNNYFFRGYTNYKYPNSGYLCEFYYSIYEKGKKKIQASLCNINIWRNVNELNLEIRFLDNKGVKQVTKSINQNSYLDFLKSKILYLSFKIFTIKTNEIQILKTELNLLDKYLNEILIYIDCDINEINNIIYKKNSKNGSFEKGYVLLNTLNSYLKFNYKLNEKNLNEFNLFNQDFDQAKRINEIPLEIKRNIDLLIDDDRKILLLKVQCPTTFRNLKIEFKGNKIDEYFGEKNKIIIYFKQLRDSYYGRIYIDNEFYEQQQLKLF
ncbi:hypothetical protein B5E48_11530 [Massilimicrobiota sp. An105]|uniref:nucleoside triphosphate pyrophosphohydrolase n=1 Tax=Massilimicrobiota sp. An105 TaxID=1965540 RepID=UPI000B3870FF|nr:nucleoside triphosphate pyrophosphohydrolase [Massilimicrobiota sp. An105]OUQ74881.1 hypothetical protein B5E48_11530 [Massilimicrobiota sp. An105]